MKNRINQVKTILFVLHIASSFPELLQVAKLYMGRKDTKPVFLFDERYYPHLLMQRDIKILFAEGIEVLNYSNQYPAKPIGSYLKNKISMRFRGLIPEELANKIKHVVSFSLVWQLLDNLKVYCFIKKILKNKAVNLVILGLDVAQYNTSLYTKLAHALGIPAVIITNMMTNAQEFCELYYNNCLHRFNLLGDFLTLLFYPRWIKKYKGRKIKRLPSSGMIMAKEIMGIAPPLPWQIHSGFADGILVESIKMRQLAVNSGLPKDKVYLTGVVSHDVMAKHLIESEKKRQDIYQKFGITDNLPFILLAMPQDDHPQGCARPFPTYKDMVLFLAESLSACNGYHTIVCPHPSIFRDQISFIEKLGFKISDEPTFNIIPACDIFIATCSSTIQWAISCSKPVIAYDYYRSRRNEFSEALGVLIVEDQDAFRSTLNKLTMDKQFYAQIQEKQKQCSAQWGQLDGQASDRILNVLNSFMHCAG